MQHMDVSIRELKDKLSEFLRLVAQGEELVITNHGKPLARIVPYGPSTESEEDTLARVTTLAWVRAGSGGKVVGTRHPARLAQSGQRLSEALGLDQ